MDSTVLFAIIVLFILILLVLLLLMKFEILKSIFVLLLLEVIFKIILLILTKLSQSNPKKINIIKCAVNKYIIMSKIINLFKNEI